MEILQEFALENIHCAPWEDKQFRFTLVRVTKPKDPVRGAYVMNGRYVVNMPTGHHSYHLYSIGRVPAPMINLKGGNCCCACARVDWVNMEEDMNERFFIFQMYNDEGINLPRRNIFYRISREGHLLIAVQIDDGIKNFFDIESFKYIRTYTNHYYRTETSNDTITISSRFINGKRDVVEMRRELDKIDKKGTTLFYVNGVLVDRLPLDVKGNCVVEYMHDTGIRRVEKFKIDDLSTFVSRIDKKMKYFVHRDHVEDHIQYEDDLEVYIVGETPEGRAKGLYYYQNKNPALRNVTDKDYSLLVDYVNYHAQLLASDMEHGVQDNYIYIYFRDPMFRRKLVYSALKIHELYKLPADIELTIMNNTGYSIEDFRVEHLEASEYFKVAGLLDLRDLTKELAMDAVGYSAASYYYGNTPTKSNSNTNVEVPYLYQGRCYGYEYNDKGVMTYYQPTLDLYYPVENEDTTHVEFIQGRHEFIRELHVKEDKVKIDLNRDYKIIKAIHNDLNVRVEPWQDITHEPYVQIDEEGNLTFDLDEYTLGDFMVVYLDEPHIQDFYLYLDNFEPTFIMHMPVKIKGKLSQVPADIFFDTFEIFLNGHRLVEGLDFFMEYPRISIANKEYLDYTKNEQWVHIRATGIALDKDQTNKREINGYVNHGVLGRNRFYDIRDDRVFSAWVDGKLIDREEIIFAEDDNSIRVNHKLNGQPYSISDKILSIRSVSGLPTFPEYEKSMALNNRISQLYNLVYPEPKVNEFNVIPDKHYLFSPLIAKIIKDIKRGYIDSSFYTRNWQGIPLRDFLDEKYPELMRLDPITNKVPYKLVEVHPHYGNDEIEVNVFQYRFIYNIVRILTQDNNQLVNLSGYLYVNRSETDDVDEDTVYIVDDKNQGLTPFD